MKYGLPMATDTGLSMSVVDPEQAKTGLTALFLGLLIPHRDSPLFYPPQYLQETPSAKN